MSVDGIRDMGDGTKYLKSCSRIGIPSNKTIVFLPREIEHNLHGEILSICSRYNSRL